MKLHLSLMSSGRTYSSFNSQLIPPVKHSSILKIRNSPQKLEIRNNNDNFEIVKQIINDNNDGISEKAFPQTNVKKKFNNHKNLQKNANKPLLNNALIKKRKISDPKIDIPTKESQESFFSIGEKIESNDQSTEEFFKKDPQFILKIIRNATDVLSDWDFGYLYFFICKILGPQKQLDQIGDECAIFIPLEISRAAKRPFEIDDVLIVESPYHIINHTDPPLLISPVIYHSPENWRPQH